MWYQVTCFVAFYMVVHFTPVSTRGENDILHLAECPFQVEPIGCFADKPTARGEHRALPDQILNSRDILSEHFSAPRIKWTDFTHWLTNFVCKGAGVLLDMKPKVDSDYIGIQFYGEVWANLDNNKDSSVEFGKYGPSTACMNNKYQHGPFDPEGCGLAVGKGLTNYVYKVTRYSAVPQSCPFFESRGCWADNDVSKKPNERPMTVYKMNERDPTASNWNGTLIDWKKWGKSYLAELLCRCADLAKQDAMKYFSIQFYGECWLTNEETYKRSGVVNRCMDTQFSTCDEGNKCKTPLCAGEYNANMVYELTDGPSCHHNPCQNNATCVINQDANRDDKDPYICKCPSGYEGKRCEEISCPHNPCQNNATCVINQDVNRDVNDTYICKCPSGYEGKRCEEISCPHNPCQNDGECVINQDVNRDDNDPYICKCPSGYWGKRCEKMPCHPNPCQNDAECVINQDANRDDNDTYICICPSGYWGKRCEDDEFLS